MTTDSMSNESLQSVKLCSGHGQYYTNKDGSKPYKTITIDEVFELAKNPTSVAKEEAPWFIPSTLLTRNAALQREQGKYYAVWCDFDKHVESDLIKAVLATLCCDYVIYSSRSATEDCQKWRVIIPLIEHASPTHWQYVSEIVNERFRAAGIEPDYVNTRFNQLCYLPNKGVFYRYYIQLGGLLDWFETFKAEILNKESQANAEKQRLAELQEQSHQKAIQRMASGVTSPMDAYNDSTLLEQLLEFCGYTRIGKRWLSPNSESGNPGVTVSDDGKTWHSTHASDAGIGKKTSNGTMGDAFDLYCYYEHGGDINAALKALGDMFTTNEGITINKANQIAYMKKKDVSQSVVVDDAEAATLDDLETVNNHEVLSDWEKELLKMVERFNERHAVVLLDTKTMVMLTTKNQKGRDEFKYITTENFTKLHMNKFIKTSSKGVIENTPTVWLKHPKRREYVDGVVFEPSSYEKGVEKPATIYGNKLNLWRGYSVKPKQGNWQRIDNHIRDVICSGDTECIEYIYNWIARCLQYPEKNGQVAVALKGEKGSGKGTICNFINTIFGQHGLQVTNVKHLVGNFNAHLTDCCFLFADEAFFAGDRQHENILKTLITEPTIMIERKGVDAISQPNHLKIMIASNSDWVTPASKDERRYFVLDVSSKRIGDASYFHALHSDINNDDVKAAFLFDMLHRDISKFIVGKVPNTNALKAQREQSLDSFCKYWLEVLQRGYIYQSQHGNDALYEWIDNPSVELVRNGYAQYCSNNRIDQHRIVSPNKYGSYLTSWYGTKKRKLNINGFIRGETAKGNLDVSTGRTYVYEVCSLEDAIKRFCEVEKLDVSKLLESAK